MLTVPLQVVSAGKASGVSGTSCSAPIFAGAVAMLNHELMSQGLAPMGWINPWIYANPQMFTDVTEGSNPYEKCDGFYASGKYRSFHYYCMQYPITLYLTYLSLQLAGTPSPAWAPPSTLRCESASPPHYPNYLCSNLSVYLLLVSISGSRPPSLPRETKRRASARGHSKLLLSA